MTRLEQQTEKLNALGKLAGNLAHELNNPASAAQRAASGMIEELQTYGHQKFLLGSLVPGQRPSGKDPRVAMSHGGAGKETAAELRNAGAARRPVAAMARRTRRGKGPGKWCRIWPSWGSRPKNLDELADLLGGQHLDVVLSQFASSARTERMAQAMVDSTRRIFAIITGGQGLLMDGSGADSGSRHTAIAGDDAGHAAIAAGEGEDRAAYSERTCRASRPMQAS